MVLKWIASMREKGAVISGPLVMTKADKFASLLGEHGDGFKANEGLLSRLKEVWFSVQEAAW